MSARLEVVGLELLRWGWRWTPTFYAACRRLDQLQRARVAFLVQSIPELHRIQAEMQAAAVLAKALAANGATLTPPDLVARTKALAARTRAIEERGTREAAAARRLTLELEEHAVRALNESAPALAHHPKN